MRTPHNSESRKRYFVQAIGGWRFWHASSHEFRTCHLYHAPRRRLRPEKNILVWWTPPPVGSAAPASLLDFFYFQRGPSAHRPTCGGLCEGPELSVRTVWFEMNWLEGLKQTPSIHTTPAGCVNTTKNVDSLLRGDLAPGGWGRCPTIQRRAQRLRRKRLKSLSILLFLEDW